MSNLKYIQIYLNLKITAIAILIKTGKIRPLSNIRIHIHIFNMLHRLLLKF